MQQRSFLYCRVVPAWVALLVTASLGMAQEKSAAPAKVPYKAMGAPAHPKVAARWNRYHDYAEATTLLRALAAAHPKLARLESLGKSYGKREMWVLTVTNFARGKEMEKPAFWIDGAIHANEIQGAEVVLYTAWYLLEMAEHNDAVRRLLDERVFYLAPMMSPDSRDAHFYRPNTTSSPRSGQLPVDDDRDGLVDEDGPDDLDGDGNITMMRVADKNGKYKVHPDYPNVMVRVKEGEQGQYTLLGVEGYDNDGDGRVNEDGDGYYDPNRDWAWLWQPPYVQRGAYRYPFSIRENRLVADFITAHPNIAGAQSYHNNGGMILRGPGVKSDRFDPADVRVYDVLARRGERMLPGYRYIEVGNGLYEVYGGELDWLYQMRGVFTFSNELFTSLNYFHAKPEDADHKSAKDDRYEFDKYLLLGEGTVPWHAVEHPQYGKIEVGGWKKNWGRQPPSFLLEEECHRNMAFTLYHAERMPLVKVQSVAAEPLEGGLFQVTAAVANSRLIPTRAAVDVKRKITPPDLVSIEGKAIRVIAGFQSADRFFLHPTEQKQDPAKMRVAAIPGRGVVYVRWLVQGAPPYTVTARSIKGGTDTMTANAANSKAG